MKLLIIFIHHTMVEKKLKIQILDSHSQQKNVAFCLIGRVYSYAIVCTWL